MISYFETLELDKQIKKLSDKVKKYLEQGNIDKALKYAQVWKELEEIRHIQNRSTSGPNYMYPAPPMAPHPFGPYPPCPQPFPNPVPNGPPPFYPPQQQWTPDKGTGGKPY
jgi:hypothetical protein